MSADYIKCMRARIGHDRLILVGAAVILHKDNKVLLQKRRDNLCWAIHGGAVEVGEKVEDTARRELFEETGLVADVLELLGVFSGENMMYTYPNGDEICIVGIIYTCCHFSGEMLPETDETSELKWFDIGNLPQNINPPDAEPMQAFIGRVRCKNKDLR